MAVSPYQLNSLLSKGVAELVFDRRLQRSDCPPHRRMLCTCDFRMLYSEEGRKILNFIPPTHLPAYYPPSKNLCLVWDIFVCHWRAVSCESVEIRRIIRSEDWWDFFQTYIRPMSAQQKIDFMKS